MVGRLLRPNPLWTTVWSGSAASVAPLASSSPEYNGHPNSSWTEQSSKSMMEFGSPGHFIAIRLEQYLTTITKREHYPQGNVSRKIPYNLRHIVERRVIVL